MLFRSDKDKTVWVIINLISNAIRYSNENSKINISIEYLENKEYLIVTDYGKGIDLKYKDKIFDRYFRIPGSDNEGSGLGLAICKEFIEAQGGKIMVETEVGVGSTFTIVLNCT